MHEVAVSASGTAVCVEVNAVEECVSFHLLLCNSNWFACEHIILTLCAFLAFV